MTDAEPARRLDLGDLPRWLVARGMQGLPLDAQLVGFCQRVAERGFPMHRVSLGMNTLHPRYGAHTFTWRPGSAEVEYTPRARSVSRQPIYLQSPVHYMRTQGLLTYRCALDQNAPPFLVFDELRAEGFNDFAAWVVPFDPDTATAPAAWDETGGLGRPIEGIYFSCATRRPEGFNPAALEELGDVLPFLGLAMKSRLTFDVARTVVETYLGRDAGRRVLTGAIERGSTERIRAVIWFSDLRGFTRMTDTTPGEVMIEVLDDYLDAMAQPVEAHGGQILKFMGDGLLAVFDLTGREEAPVCQQALQAAAELRRLFRALNPARKAAGKPVLAFGLALHLGEVLYGNIGAQDRLDFTVVGPAVNEASRIQALCRPLDQSVLFSSTFARALDAPDALQSLGNHQLRDVQRPEELFTLQA